METNKKEWKRPKLTIMNVNFDTEFFIGGTGSDGMYNNYDYTPPPYGYS